MRVYISGPITGMPNDNRDAFREAAIALRAKGHHVVNPHELHSADPKTRAECMRTDIAHLVKCDALATLPNWEKSRGASLEVHIAEVIGLGVYTANQLS